MSEPYLAQIMWVAFDFAPRGWARCDGQILSINENQSLYSLLGTTYGGDGRTSFALPDLRGRAALQQGQGQNLSNVTLGQRVGAENVTLTAAELPSHTHTATLHAENKAGDNAVPAGKMLGRGGTDTIYEAADPSSPDVNMGAGSITLAATGDSNPVFNRDPYQALNAIICIFGGLFPPRN